MVEAGGILPGVEGLLPPCSLPIVGTTAAECERGPSRSAAIAPPGDTKDIGGVSR